MKKKKKLIKPSEARMLQTMFKIPRSLTTNELASKSNLSWVTADKYLKKWKDKGLVKPTKKQIFSLKQKKLIKKDTWILERDLLGRIIKKRR